MKFLTEPEPARGTALPVAPGIRRIVAANPGPMTYRGTNTYLLDWPDGVAVLDPGPDDPTHVGHILAAAGAPVRAILLTHAHRDHVGALAALRAATGGRWAPVYAWREWPRRTCRSGPATRPGTGGRCTRRVTRRIICASWDRVASCSAATTS